MRLLRWTCTATASAVLVAMAMPGCRTATQVTIDVRITNAPCSEIRGTAITVGVEPQGTEKNVDQGFVTATTTACDPATGVVGTLVVTPSDPMHAAIVVTTAFGAQADPAGCKPSKSFQSCIVARRSFVFVEHEHLTLPIVLDPDCVDIPCDALSTCKHGVCYSSEVDPAGDTFGDPSKPADGGADASVPPPPPPPSDGGDDGSPPKDGGSDASDAGPKTFPYCAGTVLHCSLGGADSTLCDGAVHLCCDEGPTTGVCNTASCSASNTPYCCDASDCPNGSTCPPDGGNPSLARRCQPTAAYFCDVAGLHCGGTPCSNTEVCCQTDASPAHCATQSACTSPPQCCPGITTCSQFTCQGPTPPATGTCSPPPGAAFCTPAGDLSCGGTICDGKTNACCPNPASPGSYQCLMGVGSCPSGAMKQCCDGARDCNSGLCPGALANPIPPIRLNVSPLPKGSGMCP